MKQARLVEKKGTDLFRIVYEGDHVADEIMATGEVLQVFPWLNEEIFRKSLKSYGAGNGPRTGKE